MNFFTKKTINKITISTIAFLAIYSIFGFLIIPRIIEKNLIETISNKLHSEASVSHIKFNPFSFELEISNLEISKNKQPILKFKNLIINLEIFPLLNNEINLSLLNLEEADLLFEVYKNHKTNWEIDSKEKNSSNSNKTNWTIKIDQFLLQKNKVTFNDYNYTDPVNFPIGPFTLDIVNFSTKINSESKLNDLNLNLGKNGQLKLNGKLSLQPIIFELNYQAENLPLQLISSFLSNSTFIKIQDGKLFSQGNVKYQNANLNLNTNVQVKNLRLRDQTTEFLSMTNFDMTSIKFNSVENMYLMGPLMLLD